MSGDGRIPSPAGRERVPSGSEAGEGARVGALCDSFAAPEGNQI